MERIEGGSTWFHLGVHRSPIDDQRERDPSFSLARFLLLFARSTVCYIDLPRSSLSVAIQIDKETQTGTTWWTTGVSLVNRNDDRAKLLGSMEPEVLSRRTVALFGPEGRELWMAWNTMATRSGQAPSYCIFQYTLRAGSGPRFSSKGRRFTGIRWFFNDEPSPPFGESRSKYLPRTWRRWLLETGISAVSDNPRSRKSLPWKAFLKRLFNCPLERRDSWKIFETFIWMFFRDCENSR